MTRTDIAALREALRRVIDAHNATVGTTDIGALMDAKLAMSDLADIAVAALPAMVTELEAARAVVEAAARYREFAEEPPGHLDTFQDMNRDDIDSALARYRAVVGT